VRDGASRTRRIVVVGLLLVIVAAPAAGWRPLLARLVLAVLGDEEFVARVLAAS
jgi:hypothetical protein